ncbi:MAG: hypothetical protein F4203_03585 [Rhodobacteraceae bacterium]|nr:hypothetical protein [Paracoccaceae bacterium]
MPVIVETEFYPANSVEQDAIVRIGETIDGLQVEGVLAVKIPIELSRHQTGLAKAVGDASFDYCLFFANGESFRRWPTEGWISATINQIAEAIEHAASSETRLETAAHTLEDGIRDSASLLRRFLTHHPDMFDKIGNILQQEDSEQTTRMAVAIIANAFVFQSAIAGNNGIKAPEDLIDDDGKIYKTSVLSCWRDILNINYWPIFNVAMTLLQSIPAAVANPFLLKMIDLSERLAGLGASSMHDLSGQMFQRLISDRKFLATFYTLPASATLLAELAIGRLNVNWENLEAIRKLTIADLACGTGSLLGAAQKAVSVRIRRSGGDDRNLHSLMMENMLVAADIMPAATHLTASTLSSAHPGIPFDHTRIFTMPYGQEDRDTYIGSLELILENQAKSIFGTGTKRRASGTGEDRGQEAVISQQCCDIIIMNPPFTRPTNHEKSDMPIPSFAGFATSEDEQKIMAERLKSIRTKLIKQHRQLLSYGVLSSPPAGHGNAGLASNFIDLAHAKLRPGGVLALVLPASFTQGAGWDATRYLLENEYKDIQIIGIASEGFANRSFSADTSMAEILLVATRREDNDRDRDNTAAAVTLYQRPEHQLDASLTAAAISNSTDGKREYGKLIHGDTNPTGHIFQVPFDDACRATGLQQWSIADCMIQLATGRLRHPQTRVEVCISMTKLDNLGRRGVLHRDINGSNGRGPFDIVPLPVDDFPNYPVLWGHEAARETQLLLTPDRKGEVRQGYQNQAIKLWNLTSSRLHFNLDFGLNCQPLAACFTERSSIGGRAWPNFIVNNEAWEVPLLLWANSTLGLMSFWWLGTRQHQGRSILTITRLPELLALDTQCLTEIQLEQCNSIFERFKNQPLLPANEAYRDVTRKALDRAIIIQLLNLDEAVLDGVEILREQWCREPTVHGGKETRP